MKTLSCLTLVSLSLTLSSQAQTSSSAPAAGASAPQDTPYEIVSRDANSRVWERTQYEQGGNGEWVPKVHRYVELATGLNYEGPDGDWNDSQEQIEIGSYGGAQAVQGQHQAYFPSDIYNGVIEIITPDGKDLKSRPLGISYFDGTNSVLIAELTNSVGQLISSNQVIYTNAFTDFPADLIVTYRKGGVECDLAFRSQIPPPEAYGLSSASPSTRLELLTEFFDTPEPEQFVATMDPASGLSDSPLSFGKMQMVRGKAFKIGSRAGAAGINVAKTWIPDLDGRTVLVEEVPFRDIQPFLQTLPPLQTSSASASVNSALHKLSAARLLPPARIAQFAKASVRMAKADQKERPGVVLDYNMISLSQTNFTFQGNTTYLISAPIYLVGSNVAEGGTVIKYNSGASMQVLGSSSSFNCQSQPYSPVVFTAVDDNTVGESMGSGTPSGYYASPALYFYDPSAQTTPLLRNIRISYAATGVQFANPPLTIYDAQFRNCQTGIWDGYAVQLRNVLFANCSTNVSLQGGSLDAQNVTFTGAQWIGSYGSVTATNCIFANTSWTGTNSPGGNNNGFYNSPEFGSSPFTNNFYPFQTVGAGSYYLTNGTAFADNGTINIDATLLAELPNKTTYPPIVYSSTTITTNLELGPRAIRDTNTPDLGYHYDPLDWCFGRVQVNSNITFDAGTAVGWFEVQGGNDWGIVLNNDSTNTFNGTVTSPCVLARYDTVQEGGNGNWTPKGYLASISTVGNSSYFAEIDAKFLHSYTLATDPNHFRDYLAQLNVHVNDCEFYNASITGYWLGMFATNCLFDRLDVGTQQKSAGIYLRNCTMHGRGVVAQHSSGVNWPVWVENCAFDGSAQQMDSNTNMTYCNYNAFLNSAQRLNVQGSNDVVVTNIFTWQPGPLGAYYQPTNSLLIDSGSVTAGLVGLYHFTTQTNQTIEGTSPVDIGYHYVAVDGNGNPIDSNDDGLPDYLEDANGNGLWDVGIEPNDWKATSPDNSGAVNLQVYTPLK